jgi:hypothetical protein
MATMTVYHRLKDKDVVELVKLHEGLHCGQKIDSGQAGAKLRDRGILTSIYVLISGLT